MDKTDVPFIQIHQPSLKAVSRFMAKQDIRYYLNGLHVEATKTHTILVATDGRKLLAVRQKATNNIEAPTSLIMPDDAVKLLTMGCRPRNALQEFNLQDRGNGKWTGRMLGVPSMPWIEFEKIEGVFPNWRKVVPEKFPDQPGAAQINPNYIKLVNDSYHDLVGRPFKRNTDVPIFFHDNSFVGGKVIVVAPSTAGLDFFAVIMGIDMRDDLEKLMEAGVPAWAVPPKKNESK